MSSSNRENMHGSNQKFHEQRKAEMAEQGSNSATLSRKVRYKTDCNIISCDRIPTRTFFIKTHGYRLFKQDYQNGDMDIPTAESIELIERRPNEEVKVEEVAENSGGHII